MDNNLGPKISLQSILLDIGFYYSGNNLEIDLGEYKILAILTVNKYFQEGYQIMGRYIGNRKIIFHDFYLPLNFENYEQGLAILVFNLGDLGIENKPQWYIKGQLLKNQIFLNPKHNEYKKRPLVILEHEWFRILVKKILVQVKLAPGGDITCINFDGTVLKIICNNQTFVITGTGKEWTQSASIYTKSLDFLPRRIEHKDIEISIWDQNLVIGNRSFYLIEK